jgi:Uma2 family endonuclease
MKILKLPRPATVHDLFGVDEKAEIVNGQIVLMGDSGYRPAKAAARIWTSLDAHEQVHGGGCAVADGGVFSVEIRNRGAFRPDAAWFAGPAPLDEIFYAAPTLAVEVRSKGDYGLCAERDMAAKRAEYFAAGTSVVWDVDVLREGLIRVYRSDDPENATIYRRGEVAEAEPAVPGWRFPLDEMF